MERPSHSIMALSSSRGSRRILGAGLSFAAQGIFVAALIGGLVVRVGIPQGPLVYDDVKKPERATPPPPAVTLVRPQLPTMAAPLIEIAPPASGGGDITSVQPQTPPVPPVTARPPQKPPLLADHAAAGIAATHTVPPYPALAQRLGAEGKVTLRLTVGSDGRVTKADIVGSSGRRDLDQAAQAWIMGHWTYSPAIAGGVPAASQVMAAVEFTLTNAR